MHHRTLALAALAALAIAPLGGCRNLSYTWETERAVSTGQPARDVAVHVVWDYRTRGPNEDEGRLTDRRVYDGILQGFRAAPGVHTVKTSTALFAHDAEREARDADFIVDVLVTESYSGRAINMAIALGALPFFLQGFIGYRYEAVWEADVNVWDRKGRKLHLRDRTEFALRHCDGGRSFWSMFPPILFSWYMATYDNDATPRLYMAASQEYGLHVASRVMDLIRREGKLEPVAPPAPPPPPEGIASPPPAAPPPPPLPPPPTGTTYVLVVGIDTYEDSAITTLRFAENDARAVYGFYSTDRRSPTDADRVKVLTGSAATRQEVLRAIREHLVQKATRPEDTAVLYFAGHGFADAQQSYLATTDTRLASLPETAISKDALESYWNGIQAGRKVLLVDACHSGGLQSLRGIGGVAMAPSARPRAGAGGGAAEVGTASLTVAASGANELSVEDERAGQGVFTIALLNGLRGDADANGDGAIDGAELSSYLGREVPSLARRVGGKQTPVATGVHQDRIPLSR